MDPEREPGGAATDTHDRDFWTGFGDPEFTEPPDRRRWVITGLITVLAAVVAGGALRYASTARELVRSEETVAAPTPQLPTAEPYLIQVSITPEPTPPPTPAPTRAPTPAPTEAPQPSAAPAVSGELSVEASATCDAGTLSVSYTARSPAGLRWLSVYVDSDTLVDKAVSGTSHSGSTDTGVDAGGHDVEVVAEDADGTRQTRRLHKTC